MPTKRVTFIKGYFQNTYKELWGQPLLFDNVRALQNGRNARDLPRDLRRFFWPRATCALRLHAVAQCYGEIHWSAGNKQRPSLRPLHYQYRPSSTISIRHCARPTTRETIRRDPVVNRISRGIGDVHDVLIADLDNLWHAAARWDDDGQLAIGCPS
jgi:hypothetical protein